MHPTHRHPPPNPKPLRTASGWISRALAALLAAALLLRPAPAAAHGFVVRAIPENRAVLERAPARVQFWFSEGLEPDFSRVTVRDQAGNVVAEGGVSAGNTALLSARLPAALPDGAYLSELRVAFASDGHLITETRVFFVGEEVGGVAGAAASDQAAPLEALWRALSLTGSLLLLGAFTLYSLVLVPAWGSAAHPAGLLPPRLMRRLSLVIAGGLAAALAGALVAIMQQAMSLFNASLAQVIEQNLWGIVRVGTRFGDLWNARLLLLLLVAALYAASLYWRDERPLLVRPFWTANAWAAALALGTFSAGSHAAGSPLWPWVGVFVDWTHALAVGLWAGGLGALALALPVALRPYTGEARRLALLAALNRFSRLAAVCVAVVIATGIYSSLNWIYTPGDLTGTTFGQALLFKLALVAGLLAVALLHHAALRPGRFARLSALTRRVQAFAPTLRLEALLALLVIGAVGLLSATPVPVPPFVQAAPPPPSAALALGDLDIRLTISPGGPGVNTADVQASLGGQPADGLPVRVQFASPARDWRSAWYAAENAEGGLYTLAGADINRAGAWWTLVNVTLPDGETRRAAFAWDITDEAAARQTRDPSLLNLLALAGVLAALAWAAYPLARRVYRRLDLKPLTALVAGGVVVLSAVLIVASAAIVQQTQAQYEATLNPPPAIINPALPDAASLERGRALLASGCGWSGEDLDTLVERLPRTRDETLFAAARDGWRGLPACAGLDDAGRWHVVNAVRALGDP